MVTKSDGTPMGSHWQYGVGKAAAIDGDKSIG